MRRILSVALVLVCVVVTGWFLLATSRYGRTIGLLIRAAEVDQPVLQPLARWQTSPITETERTLHARRGTLRGRLYRPQVVRTRPLLLVSGVNALGIDEPRLRRFAADIARSGTPVLTPELPDLREYLVTAQLTDDIEDAALALLDADDVPSRDGRIGLLGISFSGGLAVVAAGRPTLRDRVAFVFTFGAHANLPRVSRYLSTGVLPDGSVLPPHDYGGVILLTNLADQVVPPAQVEPLRTAINRFLYASHVAMFDEKEAARQFGEAQRLAAELPAEAARLMHLVNTRDVDALGAVLLPHVDAGQADAALSPDQSPPPPAPVYLLHSAGDTVIPTSEALALAAHLTARGTPARVLVTPVLGHAELQLSLGARDVWDLLRFWSDMPW